MKNIKLPSGREIGDYRPPFIIAEVGSNWASLNDCLFSIEQAKECGADAVKFQLFDGLALYGSEPEGGWNFSGELPKDWLPKLKERADSVGIEFMCSAFSPELVREVDKYVNIHKVASSEMCHVRMLETLREIGKPVIMSTGAHTEDEIRKSVEVLDKTPLVLLYCVASYPANDVNLDCIPTLRDLTGCMTGYSDHTLDNVNIPRMSTYYGAVVLEKHFTALPELNSPDQGHSLTPDQFGRMVKSIHVRLQADLGPSSEESPMTLRHNRRLIATRNILAGEKFKEGDNFGIYRALTDQPMALSPFAIDQVHGRLAKRSIEAGEGITAKDI